MREHIRRPDGTLIDCELWGVTRSRLGAALGSGARPMSAPAGTARLEADGGAAAAVGGVLPQPAVPRGRGRHPHAARRARRQQLPGSRVIVREIAGVEGALDATSPYSYPGAAVEGDPIDPADVDWSGAGLVSRLHPRPARRADGAAGRRRPLGRARLRSGAAAQVTDERPPADPQERGRRLRDQPHPGPETSAEQRAEFHAVYMETMDHRRRRASATASSPPTSTCSSPRRGPSSSSSPGPTATRPPRRSPRSATASSTTTCPERRAPTASGAVEEPDRRRHRPCRGASGCR